MKRIVVKLSGMPFDPTYEIHDDTIAVGDLVRVPGSDSSFIDDGEIGTLEVGKKADVIVLDPEELSGPAGDPATRIVYGGGSRAVRDVIGPVASTPEAA